MSDALMHLEECAPAPSGRRPRRKSPSDLPVQSDARNRTEVCAQTARGSWLKLPSHDGWWWQRCKPYELSVLVRVRDGRYHLVGWAQYHPVGWENDFDLSAAGKDTWWQHAGLAESSPQGDVAPRGVHAPRGKPAPAAGKLRQKRPSELQTRSEVMMNMEECARTARGCWMQQPTCDGWWWCLASKASEAVLTRVKDGRYQPFGCALDFDLRGEAPPDARWQHAGLAEPSPPAKDGRGEAWEPETPRALYVTYSYTRTGDHAPYREHHSELMGSVEDVVRLAEAMHCPQGATLLGGNMDVQTHEGSRNDPEFRVLSVRSVVDCPLWPAVRSLVADACARKQSYFDLLLLGRAHRRAVEQAQGSLREARKALQQAEAFLAEHEAHLNESGLYMARLAVTRAQEAVQCKEAQIEGMVAPVKPIGRPYEGIWANVTEIGPAPAGASNESGDE